MRNPLILCCALLLGVLQPLLVRSQTLTGNLLPGLKIVQEAAYDGSSLYGYIDGGSTLYFEYGFEHLTVQEVILGAEKFTIEYWRMKSCREAFGIYSISAFACKQCDQEGMTNCENPYQSQLMVGHCYVSVVNTTGTATAQAAAAQLIRKLKETLPQEEGLKLPEGIRPSKDKLTTVVKFIQGEVGLQNGLPDWSGCFEGITGFSIWIRKMEMDGKERQKALVTFAEAGGLSKFIQNCSLVAKGKGWISPDDKNGHWTVTKTGEKEITVEVQ
ncbi:MAG: hypothetical protein LWW85_01525 [Marinilabiliales bacterium]|nr:hypothetical protein [Marinilabiliales bacterium]